MGLRVKGWHRFQHFKDRKPPWIKLYRDILDDREWHKLDGDSAKLLTMLWLLAAEDCGNLPEVEEIAFRFRMEEKQIIAGISKLSHFLESDDINVISDQYQEISVADIETPRRERGEAEAETETEDKNLEAYASCQNPADSYLWIVAHENSIPLPTDDEKLSRKSNTAPPCPYQELVDTYTATLPCLPRVVALNQARRANLNSRWREVYADGAFKTKAEGVEFFRMYFAKVGKSKFLTGRVTPTSGRNPFKADFGWLINSTNFLKVMEGKYE